MSLKNTRIVGFFSLPSQALAEHNPSAYNNAMAAAPKGAGCCSECGTGILHHVVITDLDGSNRRFIGSDCAMKVGLSRHQIVNHFTDEDLEKQAAQRADTEARRNEAAFDVLEAAGVASAWEVYLAAQSVPMAERARQEAIIADIVSKVVRYGNISPAQANFIKSLLSQIADRPRIEAEKEAAAPCPSGRITVEGEILTIKEVDGNFGIVYKMLVRATDGWKLWVTSPSSGAHGKGDIVRFTATVTPSNDDPKFGFGKRPAKLTVIEEAAQAVS